MITIRVEHKKSHLNGKVIDEYASNIEISGEDFIYMNDINISKEDKIKKLEGIIKSIKPESLLFLSRTIKKEP